METERVIADGEFRPEVVRYYLAIFTGIGFLTGFLIPLLPLWWIFGPRFLRRYLKSLSCTLTERSLKVDRGVFNRLEKTIPLDKITDMAYHQGPFMRYMGIEGLKVETAGGSVGPAGEALVNLLGLKDARAFRDRVLTQRDALDQLRLSPPQKTESVEAVSAADPAMLRDIRDSLLRIESHLSKES